MLAAAATAGVSALSGSVTADGSSTLGPYTIAAAEGFQKKNKGARVTVGISGTGGGFERFCRNEIDLSNASRPMKQAEAVKCRDAGVKWVAFTVANDGLSVVVNKQNTWASCLTVAELKKVWEPGSKVNNWSQIRDGFPNVPLKLFGAGTDSGTFDYFTEAINGKAKASRSDYLATEDDNIVVQGVEGERGSMGYFGFSYYEENKDKLKVLAIDQGKGAGCVDAERRDACRRTSTARSRARSSSTRSAPRSSARSWPASSATSSTTRRRSRRSPASSRSPTAS